MEGGIKKIKKNREREKNFVLHSYFFRVHVDYLATHLIRFSFFQHKFLRSTSVSPFFSLHKSECFNSRTSFKRISSIFTQLTCIFSNTFHFPATRSVLPPFSHLSHRTVRHFAVEVDVGTLEWISLSLSIFLFRAAEMKWIKVTGSLWMLPQAAASLCPSSLGTLVAQLITFLSAAQLLFMKCG